MKLGDPPTLVRRGSPCRGVIKSPQTGLTESFCSRQHREHASFAARRPPERQPSQHVRAVSRQAKSEAAAGGLEFVAVSRLKPSPPAISGRFSVRKSRLDWRRLGATTTAMPPRRTRSAALSATVVLLPLAGSTGSRDEHRRSGARRVARHRASGCSCVRPRRRTDQIGEHDGELAAFRL